MEQHSDIGEWVQMNFPVGHPTIHQDTTEFNHPYVTIEFSNDSPNIGFTFMESKDEEGFRSPEDKSLFFMTLPVHVLEKMVRVWRASQG